MAYHMFIAKPRTTFLLLSLLLLLTATARGQYAGGTVPPNTPINVPNTPTTDTAVLYPQRPAIVLEPGDQLAVHILGVNDFSPIVRIAPDGTASLPYINVVHLGGLSISEAEQLIASDFKNGGFYKDPQVNIIITESINHTISVLGEVKNPMMIPAITQRYLLDVLTATGGLNTTASHSITILRPSEPQPIVVDLGIDPAKSAAANIPVFARDTVIVPRAGSYYVLGATHSQGAYPLQPNAPTTLLHAISQAGGPMFDSESNHIVLIRTEGNERKQVKLNLSRIIKGKAPDPILEAEDVVYIPSSSMRAAIKSGGISIAVAIASLAAYYVIQ